ncbi:MAG: HEAT repeat domain-containing protein [Planctomycetia bacterium]|nr:HEAT repeat domain-containing protein [Planctomycetia bacterium]
MITRSHIANISLAALFAAAAPFCSFATVASADEFVLASGGRISGEFLNADQSPRLTYEVKLFSGGGVVTFDREQVQDVVRRSPAETEYEIVRHQYPDTSAGQWALAEWCKEKKLTDLRKSHLERVIELEPNHENARAALGYNRLQGQWRTRAEHLSSLGKVQYKGQWRYPQEIEIIESKQKNEQAKQAWFGNLKRLRDKLGGTGSQAAVDGIVNIVDPAAVPALKQFMDKEDDAVTRKLYVRALAKIGTGAAEMILAERSLNDDSEEIRLTALDLLAASPQKSFVDYYIQQLHSADNEIVNRAGVALSRFKDPRSIAPLIDALVTKHKYSITTGNPGGGLSAGQGSGGAGLSTGSSTRVVTDEKQNQGVLESLVSVVGNKVNYRFDVQAWKQWYAGQKKMRLLDVRRS